MLRLGKRLVEVGGEERGDVVLACRRVKKVARERGVEDEAPDGKTVFKQRALEILDVVTDLFDVGRKERAQQRVPVALIAAEIELGGENAVIPRAALDDHAREVGQREERDVRRLAEEREQLVRARPAKTGQLLLAKWLVSFVWYILACGIALISMFIVILIATPITMSDIIHSIEFVLQTINLSDFSALVLFGIFILISLSFSILMMYLSIMIGQLVQTHRVALSIGAFLGLSQGLQIVISLLSIPFILIFPDVIDSIHVVLLLFCLLYGALGVIFYLLTYLITAKKLNIK